MKTIHELNDFWIQKQECPLAKYYSEYPLRRVFDHHYTENLWCTLQVCFFKLFLGIEDKKVDNQHFQKGL